MIKNIYFEESWNDAPDGPAGVTTHYRAGKAYLMAEEAAARALASGRAVDADAAESADAGSPGDDVIDLPNPLAIGAPD